MTPISPYGMGRRIVSLRSGEGTGETIYIDDRGVEWTNRPIADATLDQTVPTFRRGWIVDGYIIPR